LNYLNHFFLSEPKFVLPPNGPELSCGDVQRRRGSHSARGNLSPTVAVCFARAKSPTADSVSLSDWLERTR
jgi:hypothetical protein